MRLTMTYNCDLKNLSLQLYGKEVEITFIENSASSQLLSTIAIKGVLAGRIWGNRILNDGKHEETVVALILRQGNKEIEIPCTDIDFLK